MTGVTGFSSICGQESAKARLRAALSRGRLAHAVMLTGPEGVGKQRLARSLAMLFACEAIDPTSDDACRVCAGCRQVTAGTHPDVRLIEIPVGKKDIRIDAIRDLRTFMQLAPIKARRKVGIINDAHALNLNAQNALLKTLEEPPPRSLLALVTHAPGALLPTVRSRCQRVQCGPLPDELVVHILEREGHLSAEEAKLVAAYAEGSPGRALQLRGALGQRRVELLTRLADLHRAGYVSIAQMIRDATGGDDPALPLALMLTWYRDRAVQAAGAEDVGLHNADLLAARSTAPSLAAVRQAEEVIDALARLRRGNPNRQLLLEDLFLRLRSGQ
jgi:DNA polymerase III subunit delta'